MGVLGVQCKIKSLFYTNVHQCSSEWRVYNRQIKFYPINVKKNFKNTSANNTILIPYMQPKELLIEGCIIRASTEKINPE